MKEITEMRQLTEEEAKKITSRYNSAVDIMRRNEVTNVPVELPNGEITTALAAVEEISEDKSSVVPVMIALTLEMAKKIKILLWPGQDGSQLRSEEINAHKVGTPHISEAMEDMFDRVAPGHGMSEVELATNNLHAIVSTGGLGLRVVEAKFNGKPVAVVVVSRAHDDGGVFNSPIFIGSSDEIFNALEFDEDDIKISGQEELREFLKPRN